MVTNAVQPEKTGEHEDIERAARSAIAGHPQGAVRRIVLWTLLFTFIVLGVTPLAVACAALLALTDVLA